MGDWQPRYTLTPAVVRHLMEIEGARAVVEQVALPAALESELRRRARVRSTHYSTRIEGNRLTLAEAEYAVAGQRLHLHGRERDVGEVRNYWKALLRVEERAARRTDLTEDLIQRLHALVEHGRARRTPYRDGQNTIRDSESGALIYLPPEARDVPDLMAGLVAWVRRGGAEHLPPPLIAGLAHYQLVTDPSLLRRQRANGTPARHFPSSSGTATASTASSHSKKRMPAIWLPISGRWRFTLTTITTKGERPPT
jgi:Fic family protein